MSRSDPLFLADEDDQYHETIADFVAATNETLVVPSPVVPEVCYLLLEHLGPEAEIQFLRSLANQELLLDHFTIKDLARAVQILEQYRDAKFGMVDATVMAMAERLKIQIVLTLDHRHFRFFRPAHCRVLHLVPDLPPTRKK